MLPAQTGIDGGGGVLRTYLARHLPRNYKQPSSQTSHLKNLIHPHADLYTAGDPHNISLNWPIRR